ncbi:hypothetical protein L484_008981 [Morus notabilis]|uniref:DUF868 domain-containing protein n=2 Tax=Morus notabilis TaxID=981085 RepID=W9RF59_9ROSA|nr:hypothetical protein L484_008981 [Morus notabilis]
MRDIIVSCFSENAINVSHPSCSSYSNTNCISPSQSPCVQNAVTSIYKIILSNQNVFSVKVAWCKNNSVQGLSINLGDDPLSTLKLNINSRLFRKKKGTKAFDSGHSKVEIFWDLSNAKFEQNPEPVEGFYVVIVLDSEIGLVLGDMADEALLKKLKTNYVNNKPVGIARASLVSRQEHCSGINTLYSTKARFCETGITHEILIKCSGDNEGLKHPVLSVSIDKKTVIRVKRLQWNFRGNQTIFVDGLLVDLLWDVHDWFFNNPASSSSSSSSGYAVFMFRTRSGMDSRLWLEEKLAQKEHDRLEFSLLIYACKSLQ